MEKFAGYGFNKSHSAAYGLLTIQTAYLKAHYPVEFMAALLTCDKDNTDKVVKHIAEARAAGQRGAAARRQRVRPAPSARWSGKIRFGLGAVKGVGEGAIEAILEAREGRPVPDLFDFCERVDSRRVNRKVIEALVKAGAFDFEGRPRRQLFESVEKALERGASAQRDRAVGQSSLFGLLEDAGRPGPGGVGRPAGVPTVRGVAGEGAAGHGEGGHRLLRLGPSAPPVRQGAAAVRPPGRVGAARPPRRRGDGGGHRRRSCASGPPRRASAWPG